MKRNRKQDGVARGGVGEIHGELRRLILEGSFEPGAQISQIRLGERLGVGRTPLREALRMLQQEGLIIAERNKRPRVLGLDPDAIEARAAQLILIGALAIRISAPQLNSEDLSTIQRSLADMQQARQRSDVVSWVDADFVFHRGMLVRAGGTLLESFDRLVDESRFFLRYLMSHEFVPWSAVDEEHLMLLDACGKGDGPSAAKVLARHFASGSLALLAHAMPAREPQLLRSAMRLIVPEPELLARRRALGA